MLIVVRGVIVEGYRVASGPSKDYPYGTLERQFPLLRNAALTWSGFIVGR